MTTDTKRFRIDDIEVTEPTRIVFADSDNRVYVWDADPDATELDIRMSSKDLESAVKLQHEHVNGRSCDDHWYVCVLADCAFPPFYLVRADDDNAAIDWWATACENLCKIDDVDLPDYGDNYTVNDNGTPVDIEALSCRRLRIVRVEKRA